MIVKSDDFDRFISRRHENIFIFLFHGTDPGLIHERARATVGRYIQDPNDAFQLVRFYGDDIANQPGLLADEAATIGLFGDARAIWIEVGNKSIVDALEYQAQNPPTSCKIILEAGNLKPTSPLRKRLDQANFAATVACDSDGPAEVKRLVETMLETHGLTIAPDVKEHLASILGNDRMITRSELEKLCLYALGQGSITHRHITDIMNDAASTALDEAIDTVFVGDRSRIELLSDRVYRDGADVSYIVSSALTHALRLHRMRLELDRGANLETLMVRTGIFYARKKIVQSYIGKWSAARLQAAIEVLQVAMTHTRTQNNLSKSTTTRAFWKIAGMVQTNARS